MTRATRAGIKSRRLAAPTPPLRDPVITALSGIHPSHRADSQYRVSLSVGIAESCDLGLAEAPRSARWR